MAAQLPAGHTLQTYLTACSVDGAYGLFVPLSCLISYFTADVIEKLLLDSYQNPTDAGTIREGYLIVFTILVLLNKVAYIKHFIRHEYLSDSRLPFRSSVDWSWECVDFFKAFVQKQWQFCAPEFEAMRLNDCCLEDERPLPIISKEQLCRGTESATFKITVHNEYNRLGIKSGAFVMKVSSSSNARSHENEVEAYRLLLAQPDVIPNVVQYHGSFLYQGSFHIMLEYCEGGTLEHFFRTSRPPESGQEILAFWEGFTQIVRPLNRLHELRTHPRQSKLFQGIHQDIKPRNILVSRSGGQSEFDITFKLADFGKTRFKEKLADNQATEDIDGCGSQTYSAPECCREDGYLQRSIITIDSKIDIWSLGAVFSEAAIWSVRGMEGLEDYRHGRREATEKNEGLVNAGYEACFHNGETVLDIVAEMHADAYKRCRRDDHLLKDMASLVEYMLWERPTALAVYKHCCRTIKTARSLLSEIQIELSPRDSPTESLVPLIFQNQPDFKPPPELPKGLPPISVPESDLKATESDNGRSQHTTKAPSSGEENESLYSHNQQVRPEENDCETDAESFKPPFAPSGHSSQDVQARIDDEATINPTSYKNCRPHATIKETIEWILKGGCLNQKNAKVSPSIPVLMGSEYARRLHGRRQIFLVDDSDSMRQHWSKVGDVLNAISYLGKGTSRGHMELHFTNSKEWKRSRNQQKLLRLVQDTIPSGKCQIEYRVSRIFESWWAEYKKPRSRFLLRRKKKDGVNIYILTDGVWQPGDTPLHGLAGTIRSIVDRLIQDGVNTNHVGIEFIQFGDDLIGSERLKVLDTGLQKFGISEAIVDTEPSTGNIWKMLLGSFDPYWGGDDPYVSPPNVSLKLNGQA
ncbi:kinase-like protein [Lojkania enalia]|uniref:non-specific serine/threonine protein kinase n=1 Tax=Lojkania enalia TaxID=147567 RepID=A0A9P4KC89_9PLEO|nr:kinase-like protein [Didymosphaeria enalia]